MQLQKEDTSTTECLIMKQSHITIVTKKKKRTKQLTQ